MRASRLRSGEGLAQEVRERHSVLSSFLQREQGRIAHICFDMARAFNRGGKLIAHGNGAAATDAAHIAVEFMHPVIVGKRALPALAASNDPSGSSRLEHLLDADDVAIGLAHSDTDSETAEWLRHAVSRGALTIGFGAEPPNARSCKLADIVDHPLIVPSGDPLVVQEVQETTYHILWELVHVFFEHPGLLDDACITCGDVAVSARVVAVSEEAATVEKDGAHESVSLELVDEVSVGDALLCHAGVALQKVSEELAVPEVPSAEPTNFLYPFLDSEEDDLERVMTDIRASTIRKGQDVGELRAAIDLDAVERCAAAVRERLKRGGRLISFGNGGSSTDAQDLATDALCHGWPAFALTNDPATVTAVGNDVGFDKVFARQLIPLARAGDVAVAMSTSGSSPNVIAGLQEAHNRQMLTCAITGYDGGRLAELDGLEHLLIVSGDYIPRLQEAHATIYHLLLELIGSREP